MLNAQRPALPVRDNCFYLICDKQNKNESFTLCPFLVNFKLAEVNLVEFNHAFPNLI